MAVSKIKYAFFKFGFFAISDFKTYDFIFEKMKRKHKNIVFISRFNYA